VYMGGGTTLCRENAREILERDALMAGTCEAVVLGAVRLGDSLPRLSLHLDSIGVSALGDMVR
jgi:hypothetical protein